MVAGHLSPRTEESALGSPANGTRKQGSSVSSKQLARTVKDGRKVSFWLSSGLEISGYISGMDDYHWFLVTPENRKHLIHKGLASLITLHDESTYATEPLWELLEQTIAPFRDHVLAHYFGEQYAQSRSKSRSR